MVALQASPTRHIAAALGRERTRRKDGIAVSDEVFMWKDKRVEDLSREELIAALKHMIRRARHSAERWQKLTEFKQRRAS
jgi:hypothetical protein